MQRFKTAREAAQALRPDQPVYCFRPAVLKADARHSCAAFPGKTAYAVKTNGEQMVLQDPGRGRVSTASTSLRRPSSRRCARSRPKAELLYTHPVKAQSDIRLALENYRIRALALDHEDEVAKILRIVRGLDLAPGGHHAVRPPRRRAGMPPTSCRRSSAPGRRMPSSWPSASPASAFKVGLCFHVGSQIEDTDTYERALASAAWVRARAGVPIAALDIGGGFPAPYGHDPRRKAAPPPDTAGR